MSTVPVGKPSDLPGPVVLEFLAWVRANDLDIADEEDEALCAAFLEWRMHAREDPSR